MSKNKNYPIELGFGGESAKPDKEPFLKFISDGESTSINDLPTIVDISPNNDFLIIYIPNVGHRKIIVNNIGNFFPAGGNRGQILRKAGNNDFETQWIDIPIGGIVDSDNTIRLIGDIKGENTFNAQGDISINTVLNLPNVTLIDGGSASSQFPTNTEGPYGVPGLLPSGGESGQAIVKLSNTDQDAGWANKADPITVIKDIKKIITEDLKTLEFVGEGAGITNLGDGRVLVRINGADRIIIREGNEFCPNFPVTYINSNSFSLNGIDQTNLFSIGKRLIFYLGALEVFGIITESVFRNGNTVVTCTMENDAEIANTLENVCFVTGVSGWSQINSDFLNGVTINAISTGLINGVSWWVLVGNGGNLFTSTDRGETWTKREANTTENLRGVAYSPVDEVFVVVGNQDTLRRSENGINWTNGSIIRQIGQPRQNARVFFDSINNWFWWVTGDGSSFSYGRSLDNGLTGDGGNYNTGPSPVGNLISYNSGRELFCGSNGIYNLVRGSSNIIYSFNAQASYIFEFPENNLWLAFSTDGQSAYSLYDENTNPLGTNPAAWLPSETPVWASNSAVRAVAVSQFLRPLIVAVGDAGNISTSTDYGRNFTPVPNIFDVDEDVIDVVYSEFDKRFIAIGNRGKIAMSVNGVT